VTETADDAGAFPRSSIGGAAAALEDRAGDATETTGGLVRFGVVDAGTSTG
jgi:hypothetical protein